MSTNFNQGGGGSPEPKEKQPVPTLIQLTESFVNKWLVYEIRQMAKEQAWYDRFIRGKWDPELVEISEIGPQRFKEETCV